MTATDQTPNYGLHQWQGTDQFLREDFNEDNRKLDGAVSRVEGKADRALTGLAGVSYNVYNLMLQNYYEARHTGYRRALAFDGFLDDGGVSACTGAVCWGAEEKALLLVREPKVFSSAGAEFDVTAYEQTHSVDWVCPLDGVVARLQVEIAAVDMSAGSSFRFRMLRGGAAVFTHSSGVTGRGTMVVSPNVSARNGDVFRLEFTYQPSTYSTATRIKPPFLITLDPADRGAGTMTAVPQALGQTCTAATAYVRYSGGQLAVSLGTGGAFTALTSGPVRDAQTLTGTPCLEQSFTLADGSAFDTAVIRLALTAAGDGEMKVYDYGAAFL